GLLVRAARGLALVHGPLGHHDRLAGGHGPVVPAVERALTGGAVHQVGEVAVVEALGLGVDVGVDTDPVDDVVARVQVAPPGAVVPLLDVHVGHHEHDIGHTVGLHP